MPALSIRRTIPVLIVLPLITAVALTSWLAFRGGQKAADDLAVRLSDEMTNEIEQHVESYLNQPNLVQQTIEASIRSGNLSLNDPKALKQFFWQLTQQNNLVTNVYFGGSNGEFSGVEQQPDKTIFMLRDATTAPNWEVYRLDGAGNSQERLVQEPYDHRQRPWYQAAKEAGIATWSSVYLSISPKTLALTRVMPVQTAAGKLQGVLGINLYLYQISEFLDNLKIGKSGQAFIVDRAGEIIATSTAELPFISSNGEQKRLKAVDSHEPLVKATAQHLLDRFGRFDQITQHQPLSFDLEGQRQLVRVSPLQNGQGIDWLVVLVIPEADFMDAVYRNTQFTLAIGFVITVAAASLGLLAARWVTQPIEQLNQAAKAIESDTFESESLQNVVTRPDELGELARLFNQMAIVIGSREQSLAEQMQDLQSKVDQSHQMRQRGRDGKAAQLEALKSQARLLREANDSVR
jgi:HAMP domain-containing protein